MRKEFFWENNAFYANLRKDLATKKIWQVENSDLCFVTAGLPASDQIVVFKKFEEEFIFFTHFKDLGDVWEVGNLGLVSHYTPLIPYQAAALLRPYRIMNIFKPYSKEKIVVEFVKSLKRKNSMSLKLTRVGLWHTTF